MSTRFDILAAKRAYEEHCSRCGCLTGHGCPERARAWNAYMATSERWAVEPGDDERQRKQFYDLIA